MAKAAVESRIAEAGAENPVAAPPVGTVALLPAVLSKKPFWADIFTQLPAGAGRTVAGSRHRIAAASVLAGAKVAAVLPKRSFRAGFVAEDPGPPVRADTAGPIRVAPASVPAFLAQQAAVWAEGVVQTDEFLRDGVFSSRLCLFALLVVFIVKKLGELVLEHSHVGEWTDDGAPAVQSLRGVLEGKAASAIFV